MFWLLFKITDYLQHLSQKKNEIGRDNGDDKYGKFTTHTLQEYSKWKITALMAYWNPLLLKQAVRWRNKCTLVQNDVLASLKWHTPSKNFPSNSHLQKSFSCFKNLLLYSFWGFIVQCSSIMQERRWLWIRDKKNIMVFQALKILI